MALACPAPVVVAEDMRFEDLQDYDSEPTASDVLAGAAIALLVAAVVFAEYGLYRVDVRTRLTEAALSRSRVVAEARR